MAYVAADYNNVVQQLYVAYFGRPADHYGLINLETSFLATGVAPTAAAVTAAYATNASVKTLVDSFGTSTESTTLYGSGTTASFVNAIYNHVLNRDALVAGLDFWVNAIETGQLTRGNAALAIMNGALQNTTAQGLIDAAAVTNKITVASNFTTALDTVTEIVAYSGSTAAASARSMLAGVTNSTDTTTYQTTVTSTVSSIVTVAAENANSPMTFTLTTGADVGTSFTGGAGADTYYGVIGANATSANGTTFAPGDNLSGGSGADKLSLSVSGTNTGDTTTSSFTLASIETIAVANFQTDDAQNTIIDLANVTGLTTINVTSSAASGDTIFTSVPNLVAAGMANGAGDLTLTYATAAVAGTTLAGTAESQTLTLAGQTAGTLTINGIETVNIASNTSANTLTLAGTELGTVNVTGTASMALGTLPGTVTKVDASGKTAGALTVTGNTAVAYSITGGDGNDTITISTGFTTSDTLNGGAGTDTLSIAAAVTAVSGLAKATNFEILKTSADVTLAGPLTTITTFDITDAGDQIITLNTGYTGATTVKLTGDSGNADKIVNSANVALTVTANDADIDPATTITGGTSTDVINLKASGGTATLTKTTDLDTITVVAGTVVTDDVTIAMGAVDTQISAGKTLVVNAEALTDTGATLTFTGDVAETDGYLSVTGGAGNDSITGGASGYDTLIGGNGADVFTLTTITANNVVTGGSGADTLTVTTDMASAAVLAGVTGVETLILGSSTDLTLAASLSATGIATIDATNATANIITLNTGYTDATTVKLTGDSVDVANKIVNSANVALTVTANDGDIDAVTTITGGTGTDVINLKANNATATLTGISGVETITVVAGSTATSDLTITMGANNTQIAATKTLVVNAAALTDTGATLTFTGTASETDGYVSVTGGAGNDTITGGASGFDTINGGSGSDSIIFGTMAATTIVDGGSGSDTLTVTTDITAATTLQGVTNVETLVLGASTDVTFASTIAATGITTINAADTSNNIITFSAGYTGATTVKLTGDGGGDKIVNTANIALTVTATDTDITAGTTITGGTGADVINLKASGNTATVTAITDVDTITVVAGATATDDITIAMGTNDTQISAGKTLVVNAAALTDSGATLTFTGVTNETDGHLSITGGAGNDSITGGNFSDTITGGSGADTITFTVASNKFNYDVFTDAADGDVLTVANAGTESFNSTMITLGSNATFSDYLDAACGGAGNGAGIWSWFQYGGNTFVVSDQGAGATFAVATDMVIELVGAKDISGSTGGTTNLLTLVLG